MFNYLFDPATSGRLPELSLLPDVLLGEGPEVNPEEGGVVDGELGPDEQERQAEGAGQQQGPHDRGFDGGVGQDMGHQWVGGLCLHLCIFY